MKVRKSRFDVAAHLSALRRYARSLTRDDSSSDDLVHDALVRAFIRRDSFDESRDLKPWLLSILHNLFVDRQRTHDAERARIERAAVLKDSVQAPTQEQHVRLQQVRMAMLQLPEEQRSALHLVAIEGLTFAEAASVLNIPLGTLMSRLARARATLRALDDGYAGAAVTRGPRPHLRIVGGADEPAA